MVKIRIICHIVELSILMVFGKQICILHSYIIEIFGVYTLKYAKYDAFNDW